MISADGIAAISSFVFFFALPALLFAGMVEKPVQNVIAINFVTSYTLAIGILFAVIAIGSKIIFKYSLADSSIIACVSSLPNLGLMGIPALVLIMGDRVLVPLTIIWLIDMVFILPLTILLIEYDRAPGELFKKSLEALRSSLLSNPVVSAALLGALLSSIGVSIPSSLYDGIRFLGNAAGPAALFALGGMLASQSISLGNAMTNWLSNGMVFLKIVIQPVFTYLVMTTFGVDSELRLIGTMGAAIPVAVLSFLVADRYKALIEPVSMATIVSTAFSILTLAAFLSLLG